MLPPILEPTAGVAALPRSPEIVDGERPSVRAARDLPHAATSRPQNGDLLALGKRQVPDGGPRADGRRPATLPERPTPTAAATPASAAASSLDSPRVIAAPKR